MQQPGRNGGGQVIKFTIVGAGALGSILGAHLIQAGHAVRMLVRGARARELALHGLRVRGLRTLDVPCAVVTAPLPAGDEDVLVFAVKTYQMDAAIDAARSQRPPAVFALANGVMKNEQLAAAFGRNPVLGCMANFSGELRDDGSVLFTRNVLLALGGPAAVTEDVVRAIDAAGIVCTSSRAIESVEWSKFVGWVALFALAVIARCPTGRYLDNPHLARLAVTLIKEAAALAAARNIPLTDQSPLPVARIAEAPFRSAVAAVRATGRELAASAPDHRMSALQDLEAGRTLEVHETLGYAVREAARLGVDAPTLALCYEIGAGLNAIHQ